MIFSFDVALCSLGRSARALKVTADDRVTGMLHGPQWGHGGDSSRLTVINGPGICDVAAGPGASSLIIIFILQLHEVNT